MKENGWYETPELGCNAKSITTRIETQDEWLAAFCGNSVATLNPLQQGLKRDKLAPTAPVLSGCNAKSITTRIETLLRAAAARSEYLLQR